MPNTLIYWLFEDYA